MQFGEERRARSIARAIVNTRRTLPLKRTEVLADVVARAVVGAEKRKSLAEPAIMMAGTKHPATRT
jgi:16S rRNA C1402 N4-methylase RsmH